MGWLILSRGIKIQGFKVQVSPLPPFPLLLKISNENDMYAVSARAECDFWVFGVHFY